MLGSAYMSAKPGAVAVAMSGSFELFNIRCDHLIPDLHTGLAFQSL